MRDNQTPRPRISIIKPAGPESGPVGAILPADHDSLVLSFSSAFTAVVRPPMPRKITNIRGLDR